VNDSLRARRIGALCMLGASILFALGGLLIKSTEWSPLAINSGRSLVSCMVIGLYMKLTGKKLKFSPGVFIGALCMCATTTLFVFANKFTTAANAIVLQYTAPVFIIILMLLFFGKKPQKADLIACAAVFVGIILFFLDSLSTGGMLGNVLAVLSGVSYAGVFMLNTFPKADPISSVLLGHGAGALLGLPWLIAVFAEGGTALTPQAIGAVIALGALQMGLAYILFTTGVRYTPPVTASLISGIEPVLNPVLVAVFYGEVIGVTALCGAVIVVLSLVIYNIWQTKAEPKAE